MERLKYSSCQDVKKNATAEHALWVAVLRLAVLDLLKGVPGVEKWFEAKRIGVGSYLWICHFLDLNANKFTHAVYAQKDKGTITHKNQLGTSKCAKHRKPRGTKKQAHGVGLVRGQQDARLALYKQSQRTERSR